jgi:hypothetical protein
MGQATRHDAHTCPLSIQTRSAPYRIAETVTRHSRGLHGVRGPRFRMIPTPRCRQDETTTPFCAVFWVLPQPFFPAYLHTYGPNHSLIGLFRAPKWAEHGQCCGGATPPGTVSGCVCNTWARGDTRHRRLWQQQGKREAAYELLAQVYNWFTEGFDTADLQEAKALEEFQG